MEMNEILNGLNSCEGISDYGSNCHSGCGFGSWIWILLILFYSTGNRGNNCCQKPKNDCCCNTGGYGGSNTGSYLFLLVILFLCNGCSGNNGIGNGNLFGGCC